MAVIEAPSTPLHPWRTVLLTLLVLLSVALLSGSLAGFLVARIIEWVLGGVASGP